MTEQLTKAQLDAYEALTLLQLEAVAPETPAKLLANLGEVTLLRHQMDKEVSSEG